MLNYNEMSKEMLIAHIQTMDMQLNGFAKACAEKEYRIAELEHQLQDHSAQDFSIGETYANALSRIAELEAQIAAASAPSDTDKVREAVEAMNRAKLLPIWDNDVPHKLHVELDVIFKALSSMAAQAPVREVPGWQPISTAPKDGTRFLAVYEGKVDFYHWQEMRDFPTAPVGWRNSFITVYPENEGPKFWMSLPSAPVQQEGE